MALLLYFTSHSAMEVDQATKPEELGEEDLVDYEDEDDTTATPVHKAAESGKEPPKKYAMKFYAQPFCPPALKAQVPKSRTQILHGCRS